MSITAQLRNAKALWDKAKKTKTDFDTAVTDGIYVGRLVKAQLGESQNTQRLQVAFKATILSGEFKGENVSWWSGLKTEENFMYLQRDLARLGKEVPEDISDLDDTLRQLENEKPKLRFKVQHNGEYVNVRIIKALDVDVSDDDNDEEEIDDNEVEEEVEAETETEDTDTEESEEDAETEDVEEEADEEDDAEEPASDLDVGMRVAFSLKGKDTVGEVTKIDYKKEEALVKSDAGPSYKVRIDKLKPAPKTKVTKKKK